MERAVRLLAILAGLGFAASAGAGAVEVTVPATAGPWNWNANLNAGFAYGPAQQDFSPPITISFASIGTGAGGDLFITYRSGLTSSFLNVPPTVDQAGYVGSIFKDDVIGSSGEPLPSGYMSPEWGANLINGLNPPPSQPLSAGDYGIFLNALVGALVDATGAIVGNPFPIGYVIPVPDQNSPSGYSQGYVFGISFGLPANTTAVALQLGINDDIFGFGANSPSPGDNTGALQICVGSDQRSQDACLSPAAVPEPESLALGSLALLAMVLAGRARRS
jgi:hypothetical protein